MNRSGQVTGINWHYKKGLKTVNTPTPQPNRTRINQLQRERRKRFTRIDYIYVSPEASEIINSLRDGGIKGTVSAILNRIVVEWAESNTEIIAHVRR